MKVNAYMSHTIRGSKGQEATKEDMEKNCQAAEKLGSYIRENFNELLNLYIPAEHEQFIQKAFSKGYITEKQILQIDCDIVSTQDLVIVLTEDGWIGGGIGVEIDHAETENIPVFYVDIRQEMEMTWKNLELVLRSILEKKKSNGAVDEEQPMMG